MFREHLAGTCNPAYRPMNSHLVERRVQQWASERDITVRPADASSERHSSQRVTMIDKATQRISNADREDTAAHLGAAMSEGRLTIAEYEERLTKAYAAQTYGELEPLTKDIQYALVPRSAVQAQVQPVRVGVSAPRPVSHSSVTNNQPPEGNRWDRVLFGVMVSMALNLIGVIVSWVVAGTPTEVTAICGLLFAAGLPTGNFAVTRADALDARRKRANAYIR